MISDLLGLLCDKEWPMGVTLQHGNVPRDPKVRTAAHTWILECRSSCVALSKVVDMLLLRLEPHVNNVKRLAGLPTVAVKVACVFYGEGPPGLWFGPEVMAKIADMGAGLDIDLYIGEEFA
ncbi:MAG: DUF4279 domain-containing protein [Planctomycetes bacterium]|nr:DUF4279 domain-containing protein [Planctomycetota bacterium]